MRAACWLAAYPPWPPLEFSSSAGVPDCPPVHESETPTSERYVLFYLQYHNRMDESVNYLTVTWRVGCGCREPTCRQIKAVATNLTPAGVSVLVHVAFGQV